MAYRSSMAVEDRRKMEREKHGRHGSYYTSTIEV